MKFLTTICMAALATALFRMLVPENKFSKQVSILIAAVFILTGISAVSGAELDLGLNSGELQAEEMNARISFAVNTELEERICAELSGRIFALLHSREIYPEEIRVGVNISGLYSIDITQVELVFIGNQGGEQAAANAAAELLKSELSPEIRIITDVKE